MLAAGKLMVHAMLLCGTACLRLLLLFDVHFQCKWLLHYASLVSLWRCFVDALHAPSMPGMHKPWCPTRPDACKAHRVGAIKTLPFAPVHLCVCCLLSFWSPHQCQLARPLHRPCLTCQLERHQQQKHQRNWNWKLCRQRWRCDRQGMLAAVLISNAALCVAIEHECCH
jgi:hypothetical protein